MPTRTKAPSEPGSGQRTRSRGRGPGGFRLADAFESVERLPALSESRARVLRLAEGASPPLEEIVDAVESDAGLAAAVMRSACDGDARGAVAGIPQAVEALRPAGVAELAGGLETYELFESGNGWRRLPDRFRGHAVATRAAAERVGEVARLPGRDELALAALLHDIGKLVLAKLYSSYDRLTAEPQMTPEDRVHSELREFGMDHAVVGGVLVRRWGFPDPVARAIERHHAPGAEGAAAAVRLADMVAHHAHGGAVSASAVAEASGALGIKGAKLRALFYEYPFTRPARRRSSEPCPLSGRELDALRGLADGKVYKEIASEMSLSPSTVRTHLHNVYRKIDAVDRAQAVLLARDRGWI